LYKRNGSKSKEMAVLDKGEQPFFIEAVEEWKNGRMED
jgi:hypothetical protein